MIEQFGGPVLLSLVGLLGGCFAFFIGAPLPFLLGSLIAVGAFVIFGPSNLPFRLYFPMKVREAFVAVIGVMIGATFTPEGVNAFQTAWASFAGVIAFIALALGANYYMFTRIGGYSRPTAFYASMPGGLVDSVTLGEQAGGDPRILTIQHFMRILLIVTLVPLGFWIWTGDAVGSAAGVSLETGDGTHDLTDWIVALASVVTGLALGKLLRLPAHFLMGPLVVAAFIHGTGLTDAQLPHWMLGFAQLIVGIGFGARFIGMDRKALAKGLWLGVVSTGMMLVIGLTMAGALHQLLDLPLDILFLCFAPGGIIEMGLIALSLNAGPVFVTAHHLLRIVVTVAVAAAALNWAKNE